MVAVIACLLAVAAVAFVLYVAYDTQTSRVSDLERAYSAQQNRVNALEKTDKRILSDHATIGKEFADTSAQLRQVRRLVTPSGRRLPGKLAALAPFARAGFLTPRALPGRLASSNAAVIPYRDGYRLTWQAGVSLFASKQRDAALRVLLAEAPKSARASVRLGPRRVTRVNASVVMYAWTERGRSYTIVASRRLARPAAALIRTLG